MMGYLPITLQVFNVIKSTKPWLIGTFLWERRRNDKGLHIGSCGLDDKGRIMLGLRMSRGGHKKRLGSHRNAGEFICTRMSYWEFETNSFKPSRNTSPKWHLGYTHTSTSITGEATSLLNYEEFNIYEELIYRKWQVYNNSANINYNGNTSSE